MSLPNATVTQVIQAMSNACFAEFGTSDTGDTVISSSRTTIVSEAPGGCPFVVFEIGQDGIDYTDETLKSKEMSMGIEQSTQMWTAHVVAKFVVGKPKTPSDYGTMEAAGRQWYDRVPIGMRKHYLLGQIVNRFRVSKGYPGALRLSDGWYMTVDFDFHAMWKVTSQMLAG